MSQALHAALIKAQGAFPVIDLDRTVKVKTRTGSDYSFDYATLANIKRKTDPALHKNGLGIVHLRDGDELVTTLIHTSGETMVSTMPLRIPKGASQQDEGSIVSYAKRYNTVGILGLVAEDDDDANIADGNSYRQAPKKPAGKQTPVDTTKSPKFEFLDRCKAAKAFLGDEMYYQILGNNGFEKANEITAKKDRDAVLAELKLAGKAKQAMDA